MDPPPGTRRGRGLFAVEVRRWRRLWGCAFDVDGRQEAVSALVKRLHVAWLLGGIVERLPELLHGGVEPMLEVHEGVGRPQP